MKKLIATLFTLSIGLPLAAQAPAEQTGPSADQDTTARQGPTAPASRPSSDGAQASGSEQGDVQNLMVELQQLSQRIEAAQQQARESDEVQGALVDYARSLEEQMLEIDPDREDAIKRKSELMVEIIQLDDPASLSAEEQQDVQEKVQEHQQLSTELANVQEQALQTEDVQEKQEKAREVQIAKMQEVEPNLMQLVQQRSEIVQRIQAAHGNQSSQRSGSAGS